MPITIRCGEGIQIKNNDRVFISGKTGSGKTYAAQKMLQCVNDAGIVVIVLDNKGLFHWKGAALVTSLDGCYKALKKGITRIVYRPPAELEANQAEFMAEMDAFFWWVYNICNCLLYVDEATAVCNSSNILAGHNAIMKRGRERNIGCWNSSQQPVNCHNTLISEADHYVIFVTLLESHRAKLAGFCGQAVMERLPQDYTFYYFHPQTMTDPILHEPL